jgi:hypothetical protein
MDERSGSDPVVTRECKWCAEGKPEWSSDAKVWIHRRERLDRKCDNPPPPLAPEQKPVNHIICSAHRHRSAVLVTEYMKDRFAAPLTIHPREAFGYRVERKMGHSEADHYSILITTDGWGGLDREKEILEASRAFLAGLGDWDIWA